MIQVIFWCWFYLSYINLLKKTELRNQSHQACVCRGHEVPGACTCILLILVVLGRAAVLPLTHSGWEWEGADGTYCVTAVWSLTLTVAPIPGSIICVPFFYGLFCLSFRLLARTLVSLITILVQHGLSLLPYIPIMVSMKLERVSWGFLFNKLVIIVC